MSESLESGSRTPLSKAGRHAAIEEILTAVPITSQAELREKLEERGISAAQATLSRDLLEIRATRVRDGEGRLVYATRSSATAPHWNEEGEGEKLERWARDLLVGAATAGNLIVLRTPAGAANLLASAIDFARDERVLGCVAGDDTIVVVCGRAQDASAFCDLLLSFAEGAKTGQ